MSVTTSVSAMEASLCPLAHPRPRHHLSSLDACRDLPTGLTSLQSFSMQHQEELALKLSLNP